MKLNERIVYLALIVALVIALITISTCNKRTLDENFFVKSQVDALSGDMKDLESKLDDKDSTIRSKAKELIEKKNQIQILIKEGQITATEAQRRIRELKKELNDVKETIVTENLVFSSNSDSLNAIILSLKNEKNILQNKVITLQDELSKKQIGNTISTPVTVPLVIMSLSGTKITKNSISINCELKTPATKNELIYVEVMDDHNVNLNPEKQNLSFTIPKGSKSFSGDILNYTKSIFKPGNQYLLVFRDFQFNELHQLSVTVARRRLFGGG